MSPRSPSCGPSSPSLYTRVAIRSSMTHVICYYVCPSNRASFLTFWRIFDGL